MSRTAMPTWFTLWMSSDNAGSPSDCVLPKLARDHSTQDGRRKRLIADEPIAYSCSQVKLRRPRALVNARNAALDAGFRRVCELSDEVLHPVQRTDKSIRPVHS